jgi:hypothetical protein
MVTGSPASAKSRTSERCFRAWAVEYRFIGCTLYIDERPTQMRTGP